MIKKNIQNKKLYFEIMRIIAIFLVIFNHTDENGFFLFSKYGTDTPHFWVYLFLSIFCKCAVFIFFAISGALLLGRETKSLKDLWRKKILKMVIILVVFSLAYYIVDIAKYNEPFNFGYFVQRMYEKTTKYHLWYLYAYIAFLVSLPFLQNLVKNLKKKHFYYMIGIAVFFRMVLPIVEYLCSHGKVTMNENLKVSWLVSTIVLYPCIGYFLEHKVEATKKKVVGLWVFNLATIGIAMLMTFIRGQDRGNYNRSTSQMFHKTFQLINCACVFLTVKYFCVRKKAKKRGHERLKKVIVELGGCMFGVYLIHMFLLQSEWVGGVFVGLTAVGVNRMLAALLVTAMVMLISTVIVFVVRKIPGVKRIL